MFVESISGTNSGSTMTTEPRPALCTPSLQDAIRGKRLLFFVQQGSRTRKNNGDRDATARFCVVRQQTILSSIVHSIQHDMRSSARTRYGSVDDCVKRPAAAHATARRGGIPINAHFQNAAAPCNGHDESNSYVARVHTLGMHGVVSRRIRVRAAWNRLQFPTKCTI